MLSYVVFLVMLVPGTPKPVLALMMPFHTVKECRAVLEKAPKADRDKWACIAIDVRPEPELPST